MSANRELVLTRLINAPREKVYRAWTDPEILKQWFAPLPYTTPVAELDVRPGSANYIVMRGPDGKDCPIAASILRSCPTSGWSSPTPTSRPGSRRQSHS